MVSSKHILLIILGILFSGNTIIAEQTSSTNHKLQLSSELTGILRAEMQALLGGVQTLPAGIATANWHHVAETSAQISASYILEQKLTAKQRQELKDKLPEHFKRLDADFHAEAKKLEAAAKQHDSQLSAFHYYRLLETCTACHAIYATATFPGFAHPVKRGHGH